MDRSQTGIALITVLFIVFLTTMATVAMTTRQQFDIRRTANIINADQAYLYALGAESWAERLLIRDANDDTVDHLHDIWATQLLPVTIPGGTLQGEIQDLQSRFNVNNLVVAREVDIEAVAYFIRLLKVLALPEAIAQAAIDWIDKDQKPQIPYGAEDNTYLLKTPAYRTADNLFRSPTELRLLAPLTLEDYLKLVPHITVLPTQTTINVNTATDSVLMALAEGITLTDVEELQEVREITPFESVSDFLSHEAVAGVEIHADSISVSSAYFLVTMEVQIDQTQTQLTSVLHRQPRQTKTIMRARNIEF